jgi:molecular chaperone DnaK (HSP70)
MAIAGIDLGTANSLIALWTDSGPELAAWRAVLDLADELECARRLPRRVWSCQMSARTPCH